MKQSHSAHSGSSTSFCWPVPECRNQSIFCKNDYLFRVYHVPEGTSWLVLWKLVFMGLLVLGTLERHLTNILLMNALHLWSFLQINALNLREWPAQQPGLQGSAVVLTSGVQHNPSANIKTHCQLQIYSNLGANIKHENTPCLFQCARQAECPYTTCSK